MMEQSRLCPPADVERREGMLLAPLHDLCDLVPVGDLLKGILLDRRTRDDEAVVLFMAHLGKRAVELRKIGAYWDAVAEIMQWSKKHAFSTFHICWGAQAGLYYHYGIPKHWTEKKIFGVYEHHRCVQHESLLRGFDDIFYVPHSRHTETRRADVDAVPELTVLAEGDAGVYIIANLRRRQFFITGHAEYDPLTLKAEYDRDHAAGMNPDIPLNYYPDDDPSRPPVVRWRSVAHLLFANWLNYYVYQGTPYELDSLDNAED